METFTVYESKRTGNEIRNSAEASGGYRIVAGKHVPHTGIESFTTRAYQGMTLQDAARAAYAGETRKDIKAQIARFFDVESPASRASAIARELAAMETQPDVREFDTSRDAALRGSIGGTMAGVYRVNFGDILVVPSEQVVGIACGQPFAVTAIAGEFDQLSGSIMHALDGRGVTAAYLRAACNEAARRGYMLANWAYAFREV